MECRGNRKGLKLKIKRLILVYTVYVYYAYCTVSARVDGLRISSYHGVVYILYIFYRKYLFVAHLSVIVLDAYYLHACTYRKGTHIAYTRSCYTG